MGWGVAFQCCCLALPTCRLCMDGNSGARTWQCKAQQVSHHGRSLTPCELLFKVRAQTAVARSVSAAWTSRTLRCRLLPTTCYAPSLCLALGLCPCPCRSSPPRRRRAAASFGRVRAAPRWLAPDRRSVAPALPSTNLPCHPCCLCSTAAASPGWRLGTPVQSPNPPGPRSEPADLASRAPPLPAPQATPCRATCCCASRRTRSMKRRSWPPRCSRPVSFFFMNKEEERW